MTLHTVIASVVIPNGNNPQPVATIVLPGGEIHQVNLDHDWGNDAWPKDRSPDSLRRDLRERFGYSTGFHGDRCVYRSPKDVGVSSNELGRLSVYELDYEV